MSAPGLSARPMPVPNAMRDTPASQPIAAVDERSLVRRMLAGDEPAFERFSDDYIPALYRFALRRLDGDRELARELTQTTVCKAIAKLATFRGEAALMTWLCACLRNEVAAHFRSARRWGAEVELSEVEKGRVLPSAVGPVDGPERALLRGEAADRVHLALDSLPPHYGRALEWKYLEDLSVREIALRLNLGAKAAESILTRARDAFRAVYAELSVAGDRGGTADPVAGRRLEMES